jgi:hypothetical protein
MHLIERTELVSGETCVTVSIAVRRAEIVGKMVQEQRERERENKRTIEGGLNIKARRILGKTRGSDK